MVCIIAPGLRPCARDQRILLCTQGRMWRIGTGNYLKYFAIFRFIFTFLMFKGCYYFGVCLFCSTRRSFKSILSSRCIILYNVSNIKLLTNNHSHWMD